MTCIGELQKGEQILSKEHKLNLGFKDPKESLKDDKKLIINK